MNTMGTRSIRWAACLTALIALFLAAIALAPATARAETATDDISVVIGTGSDGSFRSSFRPDFARAVTKSIYYPGEFVYDGDAVGTGQITALSYYVTSPVSNGFEYGMLDIYLGYTTADGMDAYLGGCTDVALVYSNHNFGSIGANGGWETFVLDRPFSYDASKGNLVVTVVRISPKGPNSRLCYQISMDRSTGYGELSSYESDFDKLGEKISASSHGRTNIRFDMTVPAGAPHFTVNPTGFDYRSGAAQVPELMATAKSGLGVSEFSWYRSGDGALADAASVIANATKVSGPVAGTASGGAYTSTYTPLDSDLTEAGSVYYYCVASNPSGSRASGPAKVRVCTEDAQVPKGKLAISSDPAAVDGVVTAEDTSLVTFTASGIAPAVPGDELHYQWYRKGAGDSDFVPVEGAVESTFTTMVVPGETSYQCRAHASHQIPSNISADVTSNTIAVTSTWLTISTAEELADFRDKVDGRNGYDADDFNGRTVLLAADVDVSQVEGGWIPIGYLDGPDVGDSYFNGTFDGQGHTVTIGAVAPGYSTYGLFGSGSGCTIKNLTVDGAFEVSMRSGIGGVAGVCGHCSDGGTFENVRNLADVTVVGSTGSIVPTAGILGYAGNGYFYCSRCANKGDITLVSGNAFVSGIANMTVSNGYLFVNDSYNLGTISSKPDNEGGHTANGLVSVDPSNTNANRMYRCYNAGTIVGSAGERHGIANKVSPEEVNYWLEGASDDGIYEPRSFFMYGWGTYDPMTAEQMASPGFVTMLGDAYVAGSALGADAAQATPCLAWEAVQVSRAELAPAISAALAAEEGVATSKDGKDVANGGKWTTTAAREALDQAISAAQAVYDDQGASQAGIVQATADVTAATAAYKKAIKTATVSKAALSKAIKAAQAAEKGVATSKDGKDVAKSKQWTTTAAKKKLDDAIAAAQKVYKDGKATQNAVDKAAKSVAAAQKTYEKAKKPGLKLVWTRLAGANRMVTAQLVSQQAFAKGSCAWAVVANCRDFPDALAASGLAGARGGALILVDGVQSSMNAEAKAELKRLGVKSAYIMGSEKSVSAGIAREIKSMGISWTRLGGKDRVDTSVMALRAGLKAGSKSDTVIVTTLATYPDTLSISPWSYANAAPVVLTWTDGGLTADAVKAVKEGKYKKAVIVSTNGAVAKRAEGQLKGAGVKTVKWLTGKDAYETNGNAVAWELANGMTAKSPVVATAKGFADALGGSVLAGKAGSVVVLADSASDAGVAQLAAKRSQIERGFFLGGTGSVPESLAKAIEKKTGATAATAVRS